MFRQPPAIERLPAECVADAFADLSRETALDAVMDWVSLYLPTWGTSVIVHVALVILGAFMAVQIQAEPPFEPGTIKPVPLSPPPLVLVRPRAPDPQGAALFRKDIKMPQVAQRPPLGDPLADIIRKDPVPIPVIGTGPGTLSLGEPGEPGTSIGIFSRGGGGGSPAKVVYIVDRSGSMTDSLDFVKYELKRSLQELRDDSQFHIVFFSSGPPMEVAARRLMSATERNRGLAMDFIDSVIATGGTDPMQALDRAFAVQPDVIYLLTDGEFDKAVIDYVKRLNAGGRVKVFTIGFLYNPENRVLREIAAQNGGEYKFVSEADLAELAGH
jgi:hypothetical protein